MRSRSCSHQVPALDSIARYTATSGSESDLECVADAVGGPPHVVHAPPPPCPHISIPVPPPTSLTSTASHLTDATTSTPWLPLCAATHYRADTNVPLSCTFSTPTPRSGTSVPCTWWNPPHTSCTTGGCCSTGSSGRAVTRTTRAEACLTPSHIAGAAHRVVEYEKGAYGTPGHRDTGATQAQQAAVSATCLTVNCSGSCSSGRSDAAAAGGGNGRSGTSCRAALHVDATAGLDRVPLRERSSRSQPAGSTRGGYFMRVSPLQPDRVPSMAHSNDGDGNGDVVVAAVQDHSARSFAWRGAVGTPGNDAIAGVARPAQLVCRRRGAPFRLSVRALDEERATSHRATSTLCTPLSSAAIVSPRVASRGATTTAARQPRCDDQTPCLSLTSPQSSPWRQGRPVLRGSVSGHLQSSLSGNVLFAPPASLDEGSNNDAREEDMTDFFGSLTRRHVPGTRPRSSNAVPGLCDATSEEAESEDELRYFRTPLSPCPSTTAPRFDVLAGTHTVTTPLSMVSSFPRRLSMQRLVAPHSVTAGSQQQSPYNRRPTSRDRDARAVAMSPQSLDCGATTGGVVGLCGTHVDAPVQRAPGAVVVSSRCPSSPPLGGNSPPCQEVATMLRQFGSVQTGEAGCTIVVVPRPAHAAPTVRAAAETGDGDAEHAKEVVQLWRKAIRQNSPVIGEISPAHDPVDHLSTFHALGLPVQTLSSNIATTTTTTIPPSSHDAQPIVDADVAPPASVPAGNSRGDEDDPVARLRRAETPPPPPPFTASLQPHFSYASLQGCRSHQEDNVILLPALQVDVTDATPCSTVSTTAADAMATAEAAVRLCCFGVFDGHNGDLVSSLASQYFLEHFELAFGEHYARRGALAAMPMTPCASQAGSETSQSSHYATSAAVSVRPVYDARHRALSAALVQTLLHLDVTIYDATRTSHCAAGATACVMACYLSPTPGEGTATAPSSPSHTEGVSFLKLSIANLGDSRAVIGRIDTGAVLLETRDHRLSSYPAERARITQCGGVVELDRIEGSLDVTRGLGDYRLKQPPHTWWLGQPCHDEATPGERDAACQTTGGDADAPASRGGTAVRPGNIIGNVADVYEWEVGRDEFLLIASDGLWDRMSSAEAVAFVAAYLRRHDGADDALCATPTEAAIVEAGATRNAPLDLTRSLHSTSMWPSIPRTPSKDATVVCALKAASAMSEPSMVAPVAPEVTRSFCSPCSLSPLAYGVACSLASSSSSSTSTCSVDTPRQTLLRRAVNHLTDHVLHRLGSRDNVTAILVTFAPPSNVAVS